MANLTPVSGWDGVYQIETADIVIGGAGGIANDPHQNLINRTEYIYDALFFAGTPLGTKIDLQFAGDTDANLIYGDVSQDNVGIGTLPAATIKFDVLTAEASGIGVNVISSGATAAAFFGVASGTTGINFGANFSAAGISDSIGVKGSGTKTGAVTNYGGWFQSAGDTGRAVYGLADATGAVTNYGGFLQADGDSGIGAKGISTGATGSGIYGEASHATGLCYGVYGSITASSDGTSSAIYGKNDGAGRGVSGISGSSFGVFGQTGGVTSSAISGSATHATGACVGAKGFITVSTSANSYGVHGVNSGSGKPVAGNGAYFDTTSSRYKKIQKQPANVLASLRKTKMQVQRWMWEDCNSTGFDEFIYPYEEDIKDTFDLTFDGEGMYSVDGIALQGVIELMEEIDKLKEEVTLLKESK